MKCGLLITTFSFRLFIPCLELVIFPLVQSSNCHYINLHHLEKKSGMLAINISLCGFSFVQFLYF